MLLGTVNAHKLIYLHIESGQPRVNSTIRTGVGGNLKTLEEKSKQNTTKRVSEVRDYVTE